MGGGSIFSLGVNTWLSSNFMDFFDGVLLSEASRSSMGIGRFLHRGLNTMGLFPGLAKSLRSLKIILCLDGVKIALLKKNVGFDRMNPMKGDTNSSST